MERVISGWLIVNVSTGKMRAVKKLSKKKLSASEIAIELKLNVNIPEQPILKAEGTITLSKTHLANMMIESLTDESEELIK
jgi:transcription antitermination factor NusG